MDTQGYGNTAGNGNFYPAGNLNPLSAAVISSSTSTTYVSPIGDDDVTTPAMSGSSTLTIQKISNGISFGLQARVDIGADSVSTALDTGDKVTLFTTDYTNNGDSSNAYLHAMDTANDYTSADTTAVDTGTFSGDDGGHVSLELGSDDAARFAEHTVLSNNLWSYVILGEYLTLEDSPFSSWKVTECKHTTSLFSKTNNSIIYNGDSGNTPFSGASTGDVVMWTSGYNANEVSVLTAATGSTLVWNEAVTASRTGNEAAGTLVYDQDTLKVLDASSELLSGTIPDGVSILEVVPREKHFFSSTNTTLTSTDQDLFSNSAVVVGDGIQYTSGALQSSTATEITSIEAGTVLEFADLGGTPSSDDTFRIVPLPALGRLPVPLGEGLVGANKDQKYQAVGAILKEISDFQSEAQQSITSLRVASSAGAFYIFGRMTSAVDPTTDGYIVEIQRAGSNLSGIVRVYKDGSSVSTSVIGLQASPTIAEPFWVHVFNDNDNLTVKVDAVTVASMSLSSLALNAGNRVGFGAFDVFGGIAEIDAEMSEFVFAYEPANPIEVNDNLLVAASNGVLHRETTDDTDLEAISSTLTVNSTDEIMAEQRLGKLYIADVGEGASGSDGFINGTTFTSSTVPDFEAEGVNADDYRVKIDAVSGVTAGVYGISSVSTGTITLDTSAGNGSGAPFRVERAPKIYDPVQNTLSLLTDAAQAPTISPPLSCPLIEVYRDRIVMAGPVDSPQEWFMSRQGDPTDWNYGGRETDARRPINSTNADAGELGEPITALIGFSDDYLLFGCTNSIWVLRGDPASDGIIDNVSKAVGIVGKSAWCYGPDNSTVFFLSQDGLYTLAPGAQTFPKSLSRESLPEELVNLDTKPVVPHMSYDVIGRGIHIMLPSKSTSGTATAKDTHWWFDLETQSFWPSTHLVSSAPMCSIEFDSDTTSLASALFGSRDGYVRMYDKTYVTDAGTEIPSYVYYSPYRTTADPVGDGLVLALYGRLADESGAVTWSLHVGQTAEAAAKATAFASGTWTAGLNYAERPRARGPYFVLKITGNSDDEPWAIEEVNAVTKPAGRVRKL